MSACMCGHAIEEHGHDPKFPGSSACSVEGCDCIAYEADEEEEDESAMTSPDDRKREAEIRIRHETADARGVTHPWRQEIDDLLRLLDESRARCEELTTALRECLLYLPDMAADGDQPGIQKAIDMSRAALAASGAETTGRDT